LWRAALFELDNRVGTLAVEQGDSSFQFLLNGVQILVPTIVNFQVFLVDRTKKDTVNSFICVAHFARQRTNGTAYLNHCGGVIWPINLSILAGLKKIKTMNLHVRRHGDSQ
jgi:hypothetical protein